MNKKILFGLTPLLVLALASCVMYNGKGKPGTSKETSKGPESQASEPISESEPNPTSSGSQEVPPTSSSEQSGEPEVPSGQEVKVYLVFGENGKYQGNEVTSSVESLFLENTIEMTLKVGDKLPGSPAVSSSVTGSQFVGWTSYDNGVLTTYTTVPAEDNKILYASFSGGNGIPNPNQGGGQSGGQQGGGEQTPITPSTGDDVSFNGYGFKFSDGTYMAGEHVGEDNGFDQYLISNKAFAKDQVFQLIDFSSGGTWAIPIDGWSFGGTSDSDTKWTTFVKYDEAAQNYTVLKDFNADNIYIKLKYQQDNVYFQLAGDQTQPSGGEGGEEHPTQGDSDIPSTGYGFKFSEKTIMVAEHVGEDNGYDQYKISDKEFLKYQVFSLVDFASGSTWAVPVDGWSFGGTSENDTKWQSYLGYDAEAGTYTVLKDFTAENIYIKLKYQADNVYFGLAAGQEEPAEPEPAGDPLPTDSGYGLKFANKTYVQATEAGEDNGYLQYLISNQAFAKDQVFSLIDFATNSTWAIAVDGYSFGGEGDETWKSYLNYNAEAGNYTVLQDFTAENIYIKLKYGEDNIYFALPASQGDEGGGEQSGETPVELPSFHLLGQETEWAKKDGYKFTQQTENLPENAEAQWFLRVDVDAGTQFKICSDDGNTWIGIANIENECKALVSGDDNFAFNEQGRYDIYLKLLKNNGGYSIYIALFVEG